MDSVLSDKYMMERILSKLPYKDLQSSKAVCRLWREEVFRIENNMKVVDIMGDGDGDDVGEKADFLAVVDAWIYEKKTKPADSLLRIGELKLQNRQQTLVCQLVHRIQGYFGTTLHKITIEDCPMRSSQGLFQLLNGFPNLNTLIIKNDGNKGNIQSWEHNPVDNLCTDDLVTRPLENLRVLEINDPRSIVELAAIRSSFPNLQSLKIKNIDAWDPEELNDDDVQAIGWQQSLKKLDLVLGNINDEVLLGRDRNSLDQVSQINSLSKLDLNLEVLIFRNVVPGNDDPGRMTCSSPWLQLRESLHRFVLSQRSSLRTLKLFASILSMQQIHFPFPAKIKLWRLEVLHVDMCLITSLSFLNQMPNLKKLECICETEFWICWWKVLKDSSILPKPHLNLESLTVGAIDSRCLEKLGKLFPNLKILNVQENRRLEEDAYRVISKSFVKLEKLIVTQSYRSSSSFGRGPSTESFRYLLTELPELSDIVFSGCNTPDQVQNNFQCLKGIPGFEVEIDDRIITVTRTY